MSDQNSADDFEKVDPEEDAYQDENITSTSMTGGDDMAEEDEYAEGNSAQNDIDMFSGGGSANVASSGTESKAPLISFDQPLTPTAPVAFQPESSVSGAKADPCEGCWVKNVDPRDCPSVEDMTELNEALPAKVSEPMAQSEAQSEPSLSPFNGDSVNKQSNKQLDVKESEEGHISDTDSVVSDSSEYSSSGDESNLESSDSETSYDFENVNKEYLSAENKTIETSSCNSIASVLQDSYDTNIVPDVAEDSNQNENINDKTADVFDKEITNSGRTVRDTADKVETKSKMEDQTENVEKNLMDSDNLGSFNKENITTDAIAPLSMDSDSKGGSLNTAEMQMATCETKVYDEYDKMLEADRVLEDGVDKGSTTDTSVVHELVSSSPKVTEIEKSEVESNKEIEDCSNENVVAAEVPSLISFGISETDLSNVLDKLTNEQDIDENISPVVSDFEKEADTKRNEDLRESSGSPDALSEDSESGSEYDCSSVDSDISCDDGVSGTWNPSPLYSFNVGEDDEDNDEKEDNPEPIRQESDIAQREQTQENVKEDNKLNELREDVKDLMEQMESLVKQENTDEGNEDVKTEDEYEGSKIEVIGAAATIQSSFKQSDKRKHNLDNVETDLLHVHFQSPTNMLFYDPESPIVERVSAEVQNELIDNDIETKDIGSKTETPNNATQAELQAEVVKDLKDIYDKIGATKEADDSTVDLVKTSEATGDDSKISASADPAVFNLYKRKQEDTEDEEQVVLRKKNNRNADTELHRNTVISERECDSMIIHDLEQNVPAEQGESPLIVEEVMQVDTSATNLQCTSDVLERANEANNDDSTEMKTSTDSMIIHDDDEENRLDEVSEPSNSINRETAEQFELHQVTKFVGDILEDVNKEVKEDFIKGNLVSLHDSQGIKMESEIESPVNIIVKDNQEHDDVCDSDTESIEESSPFDVSHNDTIVEAPNVTAEGHYPPKTESASGNSYSDQSCVNDRTVYNESDQMTQSANVESMKESLESSEDVHSGKDIVSNKQIPLLKKETKDTQRKSWDLILQVSKQVLDLIYWRDVKKTGVVFGSMMFVLLSLSMCSLMSVLAYLSLAILTVTLSFRIYKNVMQAVQKTNEGHPFKNLLQMEIELNEDVVKNAADKIAGNINNCARELRRLYLVEDYVDTLKFGLLLWLLTYIGGWFNGMTLIILCVVSIFSLPKVYETYKVPIDQNVNLVRGNLNNIMAQVSAKIPFPKKKAKVN